MGRFWFGSARHLTTWTRIPLQDHRAQFVCGRFHSIARPAIPASPSPLHSVCRPMALCHPLLATSESTNQTPHLLHEAEQTSKAYCKEIRHSIFPHLYHICCFDRWSSCRWYVSHTQTLPNYQETKSQRPSAVRFLQTGVSSNPTTATPIRLCQPISTHRKQIPRLKKRSYLYFCVGWGLYACIGYCWCGIKEYGRREFLLF